MRSVRFDNRSVMNWGTFSASRQGVFGFPFRWFCALFPTFGESAGSICAQRHGAFGVDCMVYATIGSTGPLWPNVRRTLTSLLHQRAAPTRDLEYSPVITQLKTGFKACPGSSGICKVVCDLLLILPSCFPLLSTHGLEGVCCKRPMSESCIDDGVEGRQPAGPHVTRWVRIAVLLRVGTWAPFEVQVTGALQTIQDRWG
jgi:hypothetical protein